MTEQTFIEGIERELVCELVDMTGRVRRVEPYMLYKSSAGKRMFHCYQLEGQSRGGEAEGWKHLEVKTFREVRLLKVKFTQRREYNPTNREMFPVVLYAAPKRSATGA